MSDYLERDLYVRASLGQPVTASEVLALLETIGTLREELDSTIDAVNDLEDAAIKARRAKLEAEDEHDELRRMYTACEAERVRLQAEYEKAVQATATLRRAMVSALGLDQWADEVAKLRAERDRYAGEFAVAEMLLRKQA